MPRYATTRKRKRSVAYYPRRRRATTVRRAPVRRRRRYTSSVPRFRHATDPGGRITGYGAYHMKGAALSMALGTSPPTVRNTKKGNFIVRHREFIGDIPASAVFESTGEFINPGLSTVFPWLSTVAQNFEEWEPRGMLVFS